MPYLRKVVFYLFLMIYLCICPVLILRLLGFAFDKATHHWSQTGIIYVSSNPPDAIVYINNKKAHEHTPTVIRDLTPGDYTIRMELTGYIPWENTVGVENKKATSIENILLIPQAWDAKSVTSVLATNLIGIPGGNALLTINGESIRDIMLIHINDTDEAEYLFPLESIYREGKLVRYFTVPQSPFIVIQVAFGDKQKYLWLDTREKQAHFEDISDLIVTEPNRLYWEPSDDKTVYTFYQGSVNRINIKAKAIYPNIDEKNIPSEKKKPTIENSPKADQVFMINNENTFLFRNGNDIFLNDNLPKAQARLTKIQSVRNGTDIFYHEKYGRLYSINPEGHLTSLTVLHHKPFIPKPIAETLRLKRLEE